MKVPSIIKQIKPGTGILVRPKDGGPTFISEVASIAPQWPLGKKGPKVWSASIFMHGTMGDPAALHTPKTIRAIIRSQYYTEDHFEWDIRLRCWVLNGA